MDDLESNIELLLFDLGSESFAVLLAEVCEVVQVVSLASKSPYNEFIEGVINLRGHPVSVVDASRVLSGKPAKTLLSDHMIVLRHTGHIIALRVERATGTRTIHAAECIPADGPNSRGGLIRAFCAPSHRVVSIVNTDNLMQSLFTDDDDVANYGCAKPFNSQKNVRAAE